MLFNSFVFPVFLLIVLTLYWSLQRKGTRAQNILLLVASYIFYGCWDYRFLSLIFISSLIDFAVSIYLDKETRSPRRKMLLTLSIFSNLGILGFFKYFDFFVHSFAELSNSMGLPAHARTLNIILPVGISFYTFQTMSYTIDVYRRRMPITRDPVAFFAFVSFFPQLVAGPIERAHNLLPQFTRKREFDTERGKDGLRQMLWGLFKKVVIADGVAEHVETIFRTSGQQDGMTLILGSLFFAIQIYCDFSGYSDMAIGMARLFGFQLMQNFAFPYFSRDIAEFWRRWHISLSSWFRDYVYIPLGGSRTSRFRHVWNIIVTFTVSGLWHGANWTFVVWGFLNGLYYLPLLLAGKQKQHTEIVAEGRLIPSLREFSLMAITFLLTLLAWIVFRAASLEHALSYTAGIFTRSWSLAALQHYQIPVLLGCFLFGVEWLQRAKRHALQIERMPGWVRWAIYYVLVLVIFRYGNTGHVPFIYFQF